ncbi:AAA family ATPase [Ornithinibacillus bavariensis]|uniref:ATP-binding protein n=1 Tax=Ornithinibacillus bavariensis TaxID=545502 RepID=UPI000EB9B802|nr:hypothetical protein [Ornithinibacillus sp.]
MKFLQATIYGFGKWVDFHLDFTDESFVTIYGENESGKTTVQRFLMFMLFGLPPKERDFYQPKTSSKMGGILTVRDPKIGEFTIERFHENRNGAAKCYTPDGNEFDEGWLQERLSGIDKATYQAIFSFSALDLMTIQGMTEDDLSEVLLGIGLTGSAQIQNIEKRLEQKVNEYFKPNGRNPIVNQQLAKLEHIQKELSHHQHEEAAYREKKNILLTLEDELNVLIDTIKKEREQLYQLEKIVQVLPQLEEYNENQAKLAKLPEEIPFPEDGRKRYELLKEKQLPLQSEMSVLKNNHDRLKQEILELEQHITNFPYEEIRQILQQASKHNSNETEVQKLKETINRLQDELSSRITDLHIGLSLKEVQQLNLPFHLEKHWSGLKTEAEKFSREYEALAKSLQLIKSRKMVLEEQKESISSKLLPISQRRELEDLIDTAKENKVLEGLQLEAEQEQQSWEKRKKKSAKIANVLLGMSSLVAAFFLVLTFFTKYQLFLNITLISIVFGCVQWLWNKKSAEKMEWMLQQAFPMQLVSSASPEEIRDAEELLENDAKCKQELQLLEEKLKDCELQENSLQEQKILLDNQEASFSKELFHQEELYPFLQHIDVTYWPDLYHSLKAIIQEMKKLPLLQHDEEELQRNILQFQTLVNTHFEINAYETVPKTFSGKLDMLAQELEKFKDIEREIQQKKDLLETIKEQLQTNKLQYVTIEREIIELWKMANVDSEEEFYQRNKEGIERSELILACERIKIQTASYFPKDKWEELVISPPKRSTIELKINEVKESMKQNEAIKERTLQLLAEERAEFNRLESSENYSLTLHKFQQEQERLKKLAKEWAVYKAAKELLSATKDRYKEKYLSRVIEKTLTFFEILTDGTYQMIYPPANGKPFIVEDRNHIRYSVKELSQGTINQLYISLRLAISEVMGEELRVPFIMDDAFVHFDKARLNRMIGILEGISKNHQILLFTCKQEVLEEFGEKNRIKLTNPVPIMEN